MKKYGSLLFLTLFFLSSFICAQEAKDVVPHNSSDTISSITAAAAAFEKEEGGSLSSAEAEGARKQDARVVLKPSQAQFGSPFEIGVELAKNAVLDKEAFEKENPDFVITAQEPAKMPNTVKITAIPYVLGVSTFTGLSFQTPDGETLKTEPFTIEITPADIGIKSQDIVDIRGPFRPLNMLLIFGLILAAALLIAAVILLYKKFSKKKKSLSPAKEHIDERPCHIIALEKIDELLFSNMWAQRQYKLFYITLVDIFRDFLRMRFYFDADKYTSRDLLRKLKTIRNFTGDIAKIQDFQTSADLVKFAKVIPDVNDRDKDAALLKEIISSLKDETPAPVDQIALQKQQKEEEQKDEGDRQNARKIDVIEDMKKSKKRRKRRF